MKFLVTAGPTREHLDDIRFLSNLSTGRMGFAVAAAAAAAGHETVLVHGPVHLDPPEGVRAVAVVSADEMRQTVLAGYPDSDAVVMTAAVADYRPERRIPGKLKKGDGPLDLRLVRTTDILRELGAQKGDRILVGFALESADGEENARRKLREKNLDFVVLNAPGTMGAEDSDFTILSPEGLVDRYISVGKEFLAHRLVSLVSKARLGSS
jgi:phosphopantothenoylcysteine decarboxylase/phosphopantothenate--cysteine ligase